MRPTISLALISKNEEEVIGRCLNSFKDLVDEIVLVDTGSTDKTIEIARSFVHTIYSFNWVEDFSAARNFSFSLCSKDFIFWVDCDDIILPEEAEKFKKLDLSNKDQVLLLYDYAQDSQGKSQSLFYRERIFRRNKRYLWQGAVHEFIKLDPNAHKEPIKITHKRNKLFNPKRNLAILERAVNVEKRNELYSRYLYYLGKEYQDLCYSPRDLQVPGYEEKAIKYLERFVLCKDSWWEDVYQANLRLSKLYYSRDKNKFLSYLSDSIKQEGTRAEAYYLMGIYFSDQQLWWQAIPWYKMCVEVKRNPNIAAAEDEAYSTWLPCMQLCVCYNGVGDVKQAYEWNKKALKWTTDDRVVSNDRVLGATLKKKKNGEGKKLNLGCGSKVISGYENVDNFKASFIDAVYELYDIPYEDNSISEIHSEHSLEHVGYELGKKAVKEWHRVLKPGGVLDLKIPDIEESFNAYLRVSDGVVNGFPAKEWYLYTVYGIQKSQAGENDESQYHRWEYSEASITKLVKEAGFENIRVSKYDGWGTPSLHVTAAKSVHKEIRVGWIAPINWDAVQTRVRVLNVSKWLMSKGHISDIINYDQALSGNYSIVIVGKSFSADDLKYIQQMKGKGIRVYCDLCEEIFIFDWVVPIIKECDLIICCSKLLAEKAREFNPKVMVIEEAYE